MFSESLLVPLRLVVSPHTLERGAIELSTRDKSFSADIKAEDAVIKIKQKIEEMLHKASV